MQRSILTYLNAVLFAFWIGGFTFYAAVVVPIGTAVLGTVEQGFVTRQVTQYLNATGTVTLLYLLVGLRKRGRVAIVTWLIIAAAQALMFGLHGWLDSMLDPEAMIELVPRSDFYGAHQFYLFAATAQWGAALVHFWYVFNPPVRT